MGSIPAGGSEIFSENFHRVHIIYFIEFQFKLLFYIIKHKKKKGVCIVFVFVCFFIKHLRHLITLAVALYLFKSSIFPGPL